MANPVKVRTAAGWQDLALTGPQGPTGPQGATGSQGPTGASGSGAPPVGSGMIWFGSSPPDASWAICNGATITNAQTLNTALWAAVDAAWKSGANIILPDLRGRVPVGVNPTGPADVNALGDSDARTLALRNIKHAHQYSGPAGNTAAGSSAPAPNTTSVYNTSGDVNNQDAPAWLVVNWIIRII